MSLFYHVELAPSRLYLLYLLYQITKIIPTPVCVCVSVLFEQWQNICFGFEWRQHDL